MSEGNRIFEAANKSVNLLQKAYANATRNKDNLEQLLFGARCYQAMGLKMIVAGHEHDSGYSRKQLCIELNDVVEIYKKLKMDYKRLWLTENRENDNMHILINRFDNTVKPCIKNLSEVKNQRVE